MMFLFLHACMQLMHGMQGPNFLWHLDGYDKLSPYNFCIHGCIDGYSHAVVCFQFLNNDYSLILDSHGDSYGYG